MSWGQAKPPGATTKGGWGSKHQKLRKAWAQRIAAGGVHCWRCNKPIHPQMKWHLGHDDYDRTIYRGPECAACNLKAAAKKARAIQLYGKQTKPVHRW